MVSNHTDSQFRYCFEWFTRTCETANTAETMVAIWQVRAVKFDNKQILRALADPLYYITPHFQMKCPHESPITQHITYTTSWDLFHKITYTFTNTSLALFFRIHLKIEHARKHIMSTFRPLPLDIIH